MKASERSQGAEHQKGAAEAAKQRAAPFRSQPILSQLTSGAANHRSNPEVRARLAAVQMRMRERSEVGASTSEEVHAIAAEGVSESGSAMPHQAAIQKSFGHHDISGIQAHTGGAAAAATSALGAEGYASGSDVAFASSPSLHTAAHEAAHVVQQRAGVHLKGGIGAEGDVYERHADAVADRVVAGQSATDLLDGMTGGGASAALQFTKKTKGSKSKSGSGITSVEGNQEESGSSGAESATTSQVDKSELEVSELKGNTWHTIQQIARNGGKNGQSYDTVLKEIKAEVALDHGERSVDNLLSTRLKPQWLEGIERWFKGCGHPDRAREMKLEGSTWRYTFATLKKEAPDDILTAFPTYREQVKAGFDGVEYVAPEVEEEESGSGSSEELAPFKFNDPTTWDVQPLSDPHSIASQLQPQDQHIVEELRDVVLRDQHASGYQVNKAYHVHIIGGSGGIAYAYKRGEGNQVTPTLYDYATSRNDDNAYKWIISGYRDSGPPRVP